MTQDTRRCHHQGARRQSQKHVDSKTQVLRERPSAGRMCVSGNQSCLGLPNMSRLENLQPKPRESPSSSSQPLPNPHHPLHSSPPHRPMSQVGSS
ncbi:hypothetical protein E2C01_100358 [Portunus trituberculatus]|uniref:Uncharacterized protein n=1 Tax=Portunus trituberculatus TaxID=210409 RepID=A0A5B7KC17_PORTR|nr:hypothetical protein [Portunus trituberculatus]